MTSICLYFQVHQPRRLRPYSIFDIHEKHNYEDDLLNEKILQQVIAKCYLPANQLIEMLIKKHQKKLKIAFSLSGVLIEQLCQHSPNVIASFQRLAQTGCVEFLNETYYHSLSSIYSKAEFIVQVLKHKNLIVDLFKQKATTFRNTELIYSNEIANLVTRLGYKTMLIEGSAAVLCASNPNFVYQAKSLSNLKLLPRNYQLSDDIAFRFTNHHWREYPLLADKYVQWLQASGENSHVINLFMDYETFGEHHAANTGIFEFFEKLVDKITSSSALSFEMPSIVADKLPAVDELDSPHVISWADQEKDLTAWCGNDLQQDALLSLYELENKLYSIGDADLMQTWRRLQTSDHFYYMSTKFGSDAEVHQYFNPYEGPYQAYTNYLNILSDFINLVNQRWVKVEKNNAFLFANVS